MCVCVCVCVCVCLCVCVCVCVYICIYIWIRFSDKEKQLFWNLKFHAVLSFIDNLQPNNSNVKFLQCYDISLTSLNLTCTKGKTNLNSVMTKHIRDHSRHSSTFQVRDGAEILASPPLMLKHKTVVYWKYIYWKYI